MNNMLTNEEKAIFALRELYDKYGYSRFKMSKFEEYDLYARNKDFLISDSVITFNDANGKLLALKPDVTLSIIKNSDDSRGVKKVYYNENVYRLSKGTHSFKEIMQVGLECIGEIDDYCIAEVLLLAAKSLKSISDNCVLDISHLGIVADIIDREAVAADVKNKLVKCIGEKNEHDIAKICEENDISDDCCAALCSLCNTYGSPAKVIGRLKAMSAVINPLMLSQLEQVAKALESEGLGDMLHIDFSVVSDIKYYNGIAFKGFVESVPDAVLSGGQYDRLMQKMGRKSGAIGFAVYIDLLQRLGSDAPYDIDTLLIYDKGCEVSRVFEVVAELNKEGCSVCAQKQIPEKLTYRRLLKFDGNEVTEIENA